MPPAARSSALYALGTLGVALVVGAAMRLDLALNDWGIFWPDEVFQSLEPAHRLVHGYGLVAWEFVDGARNWALPGFVALWLRLAKFAGLEHPQSYLTLVRLVFVALSLLTVWAVYRLARSQGALPELAAAAAAAFAVAAPIVYFSHRAMSENAAALPVALGLAFSFRPDARGRDIVVGASLLGLSVLLRLQCGVFCVGLLATFAARKEWRRLRDAAAVLFAWAIVFGALDAFTWADAPGARFGGWFHSALKYIDFNLVEKGASGWGTSPFPFYFQKLYASMEGLSVAVFALSLLAANRARGLFLTAAAFLLLHSSVGHKEYRFLVPVLPVFFALAGVGLTGLQEDAARWLLAPALLTCALFSALSHGKLTFGELGQYPERPHESAYDDFGPINRMLLAAHERPDLCGVRIDIAHLAWTGGHSHLHRRAPLYHQGWPPPEAQVFNYLVTFVPPPFGQVVAQDARNPSVGLVRLPFDTCRTDVGYSWRLP